VDKNIKFIGLCILVAALIISISIFASDRYRAYPLGQTSSTVIVDGLTGQVKIITPAAELKVYEKSIVGD